MARFTRLRTERKKKAAVAPVRRTLEATWIVEGSCVVLNMKGVEIGSSMVPVVRWARWVSIGELAAGGMAETM